MNAIRVGAIFLHLKKHSTVQYPASSQKLQWNTREAKLIISVLSAASLA